jgi:hypothetical protein
VPRTLRAEVPLSLHDPRRQLGAEMPLEVGVKISSIVLRAMWANSLAHGGSYSIYYALAVASKELKADHRFAFPDTSANRLA